MYGSITRYNKSYLILLWPRLTRYYSDCAARDIYYKRRLYDALMLNSFHQQHFPLRHSNPSLSTIFNCLCNIIISNPHHADCYSHPFPHRRHGRGSQPRWAQCQRHGCQRWHLCSDYLQWSKKIPIVYTLVNSTQEWLSTNYSDPLLRHAPDPITHANIKTKTTGTLSSSALQLPTRRWISINSRVPSYLSRTRANLALFFFSVHQRWQGVFIRQRQQSCHV